MKKLTISTKVAAAVVVGLAFSSCGAIAEKVTEEGAERIIEAESGENVDIDFDSDDGSFSVETEEGSFSLDDDGNFVVTDENGSVFTGSASDDGLVLTDENGEQVLSVDGDAESGEFTLEGADGESVYRVDTDIPAEWPTEIPRPEGLDVEGGAFTQDGTDTVMTVVGTASGSAVEYARSYGEAVAAAGLTETAKFDSDADGTSTAQRSYENDNWELNITGFVDDSSSIVNIFLVSTSN